MNSNLNLNKDLIRGMVIKPSSKVSHFDTRLMVIKLGSKVSHFDTRRDCEIEDMKYTLYIKPKFSKHRHETEYDFLSIK